MRLRDAVIVVTGGGRGIGAAMARRFADEGAAGVVVSDVDGSAAELVAKSISDAGGRALAVRTDVTDEAEVGRLVERAEQEFGPIDLFCSNAGVATGQGLEADPTEWARAWSVNVLAHVYAARAVVPRMVERGRGYLLNTCSAAGLLSAPGDAPYTATKHAAVAFAEWLAITYGDAGIRVSALCPLGVRTDMLMPGIESGQAAALAVAASGAVLEPEQVADAIVAGLADERFLILPHPEVAEFVRRKGEDRDRWLAGMRRLVAGHGI
ncbi:SDR family oxidoreductase [Gandjariella thermophila]|uniref:Dehydrogenase n=1 Tax=Gandjariella thermophila TaxID=1931992 RepID=A0A4D4J4X9_9PSEU|nr:SDR family oxidoreductase [Gandjariella thermophila]GDY29037.1 dehydrogenase [Gandjariella thermophila]